LDILAEYRVAGQYGYDGAGRVQTVTYGQVGTGALNGAGVRADAFQHAFAYNGANQLAGITAGRLGAASVASFNYNTSDANRGLSPGGLRRAMREVVNGVTRSVNYDYDVCNRLVHEDLIVDSGGTPLVGRVDYGVFPPTGNRAQRLVGAFPGQTSPTPTSLEGALQGADTYTYDANDRWLSFRGYNGSGAPAGTTLATTYDANGNTLTADLNADGAADQSGADKYTFEDRLRTRLQPTGNTVAVVYDGDGNRIRKSVTASGGGTGWVVRYLVDYRNPTGWPQVLEEWKATVPNPTPGQFALDHAYGYGLARLSQTVGGTTSYYVVDGLGTVRALVSTAGAVTDTYTYDAYGIMLRSTGNTPNNYLYAGEQWDADLNLYYNRARYYAPTLGRFWTMDTYEGDPEDPSSLSRYTYCHGNAISGMDPSGHDDLVTQMAVMSIRATLFAMNFSGAVANARQTATYSVSTFEAISDGDPWRASISALGALIHGGLTAVNVFGMKAAISSLGPPPPGLLPAVAGSGSVSAMWRFAISNPATKQWVVGEAIPAIGGFIGVFAMAGDGMEAKWQHRDSNGEIVDHGEENSGSFYDNPGRLDFNEQLATHAEWKILAQLTKIKPGDSIMT
jgi:RHS repeat-associated protein